MPIIALVPESIIIDDIRGKLRRVSFTQRYTRGYGTVAGTVLIIPVNAYYSRFSSRKA